MGDRTAIAMTDQKVPPHDHAGTLFLLIFVFAVLTFFLVFVNSNAVQSPNRTELRCSAFVTPPKGCKP